MQRHTAAAEERQNSFRPAAEAAAGPDYALPSLQRSLAAAYADDDGEPEALPEPERPFQLSAADVPLQKMALESSPTTTPAALAPQPAPGPEEDESKKVRRSSAPAVQFKLSAESPARDIAVATDASALLQREEQTTTGGDEADEIDKVKKAFAETMDDKIAGNTTLGDIEGIQEFSKSRYSQESRTDRGVGALIYPEFKKILQNLDALSFDDSDLGATEKQQLSQYQAYGNSAEDQQKKTAMEKKGMLSGYLTFVQAKESLQKSLQTSLESTRKKALEDLVAKKKEEAIAAKQTFAPTENDLAAWKKQVDDDPQVHATALDAAAKTVASKSAAPLCFFISRYLYYRSVSRIAADVPFAKWYVLEIRKGHVGKTSSGGLAWGASAPGSNAEKSGMKSATTPEAVTALKAELDASEVRLAIVRADGHFFLIVKDADKQWHNLDHVKWGDETKRFNQHGALTDWTKVVQLHFIPSMVPTAAAAAPAAK
ncbi:MAG: hypothetical protein IT260_24130 [Saprospiraceae bacterium]|nr:hypothetical protein [Saprospiraceae bacterium]